MSQLIELEVELHSWSAALPSRPNRSSVLRRSSERLRRSKQALDHKYGEFSLLAQFCLVGLTGLAVDCAAFRGLLEWLPGALARALAIWLALSWNFTLNRRVTFSGSRGGPLGLQYLTYVLACLIGAVVNWAVSLIVLSHLGGLPGRTVIAVLAGVAAGTLLNFTATRSTVFRAHVARRPG